MHQKCSKGYCIEKTCSTDLPEHYNAALLKNILSIEYHHLTLGVMICHENYTLLVPKGQIEQSVMCQADRFNPEWTMPDGTPVRQCVKVK